MRSSFVGSLVVLLASYAQADCMHGTSLHRRQAGEEVPISQFGYTGAEGPVNWGNLAEANVLCSKGRNQSPINLDSTIPVAQQAPSIDIPNPQGAEFENLGSTVEVFLNGTTNFGGTEFKLKQFHLHTPSEHRILEEHFPIEMHMVHESAAGGDFLVLAIFFQMSEEANDGAAVLKTLSAQVEEIKEPGTATTIEGELDLAPIVEALETKPLQSYKGSLTTPPCSEGINFLILQEPMHVDPKSYNALKRVVKFNSRFVQNDLGEINVIELASQLFCKPAPNMTARI